MRKKSFLKITLLPIFLFFGLSLFFIEPKMEANIKHSIEYRQEQIRKELEEKQRLDSIQQVLIQKENLREQLISETKRYILKSVPKAKSNVDIIVPHLVDQSLGNNIDLCFILAQCQIETLFGTAGMGKPQSKKSMFGINKKYSTYEDCINHYIKNLKRNYLSTTRDIHDLMNKYTTHSGKRYAEDLDYESKLKKQYKKILNNTAIDNLQSEYRTVS